MKKISNLYKLHNPAAAIGVFDGVHRGHQKILKRLVREAALSRRKSLVITFFPHPRRVLDPKSNVPSLISLGHRIRLIKDLGVDLLLVVRFKKSIAMMTPEDFIKKILTQKLNIKSLVVGKNFLFGSKGKGDFHSLKKLSKVYGFKLVGIEPVRLKGETISSTRIRKKIEGGDLKNAALMLGRPVTVLGTVVRGRGIGKKIGFPTANIDPHHEVIPPSGVYAVDVEIYNKNFRGILNIGTRPTFSGDIDPSIEIHIFNFKNKLYGRDLEIIFKRKIRNERRFGSIEALQKQIKLDILRAR
ncbi:MAG: bifunctional riboflavin kinase/FAD synthetase [Candidatus Omnitrophica bacterium]|nr:bifunctional riboflavin kinase/FAD synthetase [Candidatus Omnitrophota bacterium]MBU4590313.1 bifunctional riboflavin kinase/FAD synthetase [Candidatus Omnitrophota bacterium]